MPYLDTVVQGFTLAGRNADIIIVGVDDDRLVCALGLGGRGIRIKVGWVGVAGVHPCARHAARWVNPAR